MALAGFPGRFYATNETAVGPGGKNAMVRLFVDTHAAILILGGFANQVNVVRGGILMRTLVVGCVVNLLLVNFAMVSFAITVPVSSTFDAGFDNWSGNASFSASGGNLGGYLSYPGNTNLPAPSDVIAPAQFLGDWSALNEVGRIQFDHRIFGLGGNIQTIYPYSVSLSGPGGSAQWTGPTPTTGTDWIRFVIAVRQSDWTLNSGTWSGLLSNVTSFRIRIEMAANLSTPDQDGIDNVRVSTMANAVPGDFDSDGDVDGADFVVWQTNFPGQVPLGDPRDADGDGDVDGVEFIVWQTNFPYTPSPAAVAEPSTIALAFLSVPVIFAALRRPRR
jgi:hypothetical protein